jgi:predicted alpha/beta superfamily hydrolase
LDLAKELKDMIIVAIDDSTNTANNFIVSRNLDFTPSAHPQTDTLFSKIFGLPDGTLKSGGADNFLNTIEKQIIPFIDKTYKTTEDRGITGHSLGGLLTVYCLIKKPMLFNRYGINSPALWWNNFELIRLEEAYKEVNKSIKAKVFFSIGGDEDVMMLNPFHNLTAAIKNHNYSNLDYHIFQLCLQWVVERLKYCMELMLNNCT